MIGCITQALIGSSRLPGKTLKSINGKIMTSIEKMNEFALTAIDNTCLALFKNDYLEAENAISESSNIKKYEDDVLKLFQNESSLFEMNNHIKHDGYEKS